jgi:cell division protein YceG involved in septum cleavage
LIITGVFAVAALGVLWTYRELLKPVDSSDDTAQKIVIESGQGFSSVADTLEARSLIRSKLAFSVMARLSGAHGDVKAGTCTLYRHESAEEILAKITSGCHDFKAITFYPGATLYKSLSKPTSMDVTDVLLAAGYSQADIDAALATSYVTRGVDIFTVIHITSIPMQQLKKCSKPRLIIWPMQSRRVTT